MIEKTSIKHDRLLKKLTAPLYQHLGIHYFCYQFVSNEGKWFTVANNAEWLLYSAEHQFYQLDPSLIKPACYTHPAICFPETHTHALFQQTLVRHAADVFNLAHTLAFIEPTALGCEYYFFAAPKHHHKIIDTYMNHLTSLRTTYTSYVKGHLQPFYEHFLNYSVDLKEIHAGFEATDNKLITHMTELDFLNALSGPSLTAREYECLQLFRQGFTAKETARKLNLSHRTIEDHFEQIKTKYGVQFKRELLHP